MPTITAKTQFSTTGAASLMASITVGSTANRVLYSAVMCPNSLDYMASGTVTAGGVSMGAPLALAIGSGQNPLRVWRMINPPSGDLSIVVTPTNSAYLQGYAVVMDDVDQTTPNGTIVANPTVSTNTYNAITTSAVSAAGGRLLDFVSARALADLTPGGSQTRVDTQIKNGVSTMGSSTATGTGSVAMSWSYAGVANVSHIVIPVNSATSTVAAPTITGSGTQTVAEGTTTVGTYTLSEACTLALSGTDAARFSITAGSVTSGALSFVAAPNFEAPTDAGTNNVYDVTLTATSTATSQTASLPITVTVTNVAPVYTGAAIPDLVLTAGVAMTAVDIAGKYTDTAGGTVTGSIVESVGNGLSVSGGQLVGTPIAAASAVTYTPRGTDASGAATNGPTFTVTVQAAAVAGFDFHTDPRCVVGDLAGTLVGIGQQVGVDITVRVYDTATGALVASSSPLTTNAAGRLARWTHAAITASTAYIVTLVRGSDDEPFSLLMVAS